LTTMRRGIILACLTAIIAPALGGQSSKDPIQPTNICLRALLNKPGDYNGQIVRVAGYLVLEFENFGLYLSADRKNWIDKSGLWISFAPEAEINSRRTTLRGKYVILEGSIDAGAHGHMGGFAAEVRGVGKVEILSAEAEAAVRKECNWPPEAKP
jgi:hypothetical protein